MGISGKKLADLAGIPRGSYGALESGTYRLSLENLFRLLGVLGMDASDVWPRWDRAEIPRLVTEESIIDTIRANQAQKAELPGLGGILDALCAEFAVPIEDVLHPGRKREPALVRSVAALLVGECHHLTLTALARRVGRTSSTLTHCVKRLRRRLRDDRELAERVSRVRGRLKLPS